MKEDGSLKNKQVFQYICSGYISYFRGGNPKAYPSVNVYYKYHDMSPNQLSVYVNELSNELKNQSENFEDETQRNSFYSKFLNIISTDIEQSDNFSGMFIRLRQISNIAFPRRGATPDHNINSLEGDMYDHQFDNERMLQFKDILDDRLLNAKIQGNMDIFWDTISNFSVKFRSIIQSITMSDGTVFVFSEFKQYAIKPLETILQSLGYEEYFNSTREDSPKYFLWTGDTNSDKRKLEQVSSVFNHPDNEFGNNIKVIVGSLAIMEGVDFKRISEVHICEPWWNEPRMQQVMARAIRWCSHYDCGHNHVNIYRHYSMFSGDLTKYMEDPKAKSLAIIKKMDIYSIEQVIKKVAQNKLNIKESFETAAKEIAIDCNMFKYGNLVRMERHMDELSGKEFFVDPGDRSLYYNKRKFINNKQQIQYIAEDKHGNEITRMIIPANDIKEENIQCVEYLPLWEQLFEDQESFDIMNNLFSNTKELQKIMHWEGYKGGIYKIEKHRKKFIAAIESVYNEKDPDDPFRKAVDSLIAKENKEEQKSENKVNKFIEQEIISEFDVNKLLGKNYTYTDILSLIEKNK